MAVQLGAAAVASWLRKMPPAQDATATTLEFSGWTAMLEIGLPAIPAAETFVHAGPVCGGLTPGATVEFTFGRAAASVNTCPLVVPIHFCRGAAPLANASALVLPAKPGSRSFATWLPSVV